MLSRRRLLALTLPTAVVACSRPSGTALERARTTGTMRIGVSGERPYSYIDPEGRVTGAQPEVARVVLDRLGVPGIAAVQAPFHELIPRLQDGQFDLITAGMTITPGRCHEVAFTRPDFLAFPAFVVRKGNPEDIESFRDIALSGARLAVLAGTAEIDYARAAGVSEEQLEIVDGQTGMLRSVARGRAHAGALTRISLRDELRRNPGLGLEVTDEVHPVVDGRPVIPGAAFALRRDDTDLRAEFDAELTTLQESSEWLQITKRFGFTRANLPSRDLTTAALCRPDAES